ncbi:MAG: peptidylprolyl isomerase, partial [bacterium]
LTYVSFSATPTKDDSSKLYDQLINLRAEFLSTADAKGFITRNNTILPFYDGFAVKSRLQMSAKDSIISMPVGAVVGPYLDGGSYVIAKKIAKKTIPDSIKCRHILVSTVDPQTGQQRRTDSAAKKSADSIYAVIKAGGNFGALAASLSDDGGSKSKGGEYEFSSVDMNLAKEFYDFVFNQPKGTMEVIKTTFGYHVIE